LIVNDGIHFPELGYAKKLCDKAYSRSNMRNKYMQCKSKRAKKKKTVKLVKCIINLKTKNKII